MTTYITKNSKYPVEKIGEFDTIRCLKGPTKGKPYAVLGSINPQKHYINWGSIFVTEALYVDGTPFSKENFRKFTDDSVKKDSKIVAILIDESNRELAWGQSGDLILTSTVQEIQE